jgi:protein-disulfide isomerase
MRGESRTFLFHVMDTVTSKTWMAGAVAVLVALWTVSVHAQEIPWDKIRDAVNLTPTQQQMAGQVLRTAYCYGPCHDRVVDCLLAGDPTGARLANFIARRVTAGRPVNVILDEITKRKDSVFPVTIFSPPLDGLVPLGPPDAPIRVVIFADFDCGYCKAAMTGLREIVNERPGQVSLWFRNFPLAQDARALPAALAYLAAERQGKGWEMADALFTHEGTLDDTALAECADAAGADLDQYRADVVSPALAERVRADKAEGVSYDIRSAPGILINGKLYLGVKTKVELLDRIDEEIGLLAAKK